MNAAFVSATALTVKPLNHTATTTRRASTTTMSARKHMARLAALPATLAAIAPALATEGTGEGLGIDTPLLYIPLVLIPVIGFILFIPFARSQDNEDFTGEYDERRN